MYGASLLHERRDVGRRFMIAYLRAARHYMGALVAGHLRGRGSSRIIDILVDTTGIKDRCVYTDMVSQAINVDGHLNLDSLEHDFQFWKSIGLIEEPVTIEQSVDLTCARDAVRGMGAFKRPSILKRRTQP